MKKITKKSLSRLPKRTWDIESVYDSIIIINSKRKHESGYAIMYIVGCIDCKPVEIIEGCCDSIHWIFNNLMFGTDMLYPSGLIHFFGIDCKLKVGCSDSTIDIELIKGENNDR